VSQSNDPDNDGLLGNIGLCGHIPGDSYQDRCGYGPRLPLLIISPYTKTNFIDHSLIDQSSILRFIEDNWSLGRIGDQSFDSKAGSLANMFHPTATPVNKLFLDSSTGLQIRRIP
jgi:phospholipase C